MVAIIKTGHSIRQAFYYNENKVSEGVAQCICAVNYPLEIDQLSLQHKLNRLVYQAALNENVTRNSVHVSLNFDPSETIKAEKLEVIAERYMQAIGFGNQPYLVYQHFDAGHLHIHIVSVKIREDGSRIDTQNIGRNQSETARKQIEIDFGLVKADDHKRKQLFRLQPINVSAIQYGKTETKRSIQTVLNEVVFNYKFASIHELNAVLKTYNVIADRGAEKSRIFANNGLVYRLLDAGGNKVGVPIKASDFYNKPTLKLLQEKFVQNETERIPHKRRIKNLIDLLLLRKAGLDLKTMIKLMDKESIQTVVRQNNEGIIYGITFIDHRTKSVFNGSCLGKQYSAAGLQERCQKEITQQSKSLHDWAGEEKKYSPSNSLPEYEQPAHGNDLLDILLQPKTNYDALPYQLKKRKKRKGLSR